MKTGHEHLGALPIKLQEEWFKAREDWVSYLELENKIPVYEEESILDEEHATPYGFLAASFSWDRSPQGFEYWDDIYEKLRLTEKLKNEE